MEIVCPAVESIINEILLIGVNLTSLHHTDDSLKKTGEDGHRYKHSKHKLTQTHIVLNTFNIMYIARYHCHIQNNQPKHTSSGRKCASVISHKTLQTCTFFYSLTHN